MAKRTEWLFIKIWLMYPTLLTCLHFYSQFTWTSTRWVRYIRTNQRWVYVLCSTYLSMVSKCETTNQRWVNDIYYLSTVNVFYTTQRWVYVLNYYSKVCVYTTTQWWVCVYTTTQRWVCVLYYHSTVSTCLYCYSTVSVCFILLLNDECVFYTTQRWMCALYY